MDVGEEYSIYGNSTDVQDMALSVIPILPGFMSLLGSLTIAYLVFRAKNQTPYRRLLLGLSLSDVVNSIVYPLQTFFLPAETSARPWAFGNATTCTIIGFFQQLSVASLLYNMMLSFYFVLTVRFGIKDETLRRRYEPWMHSISIGFPLLTGICGVLMGKFVEAQLSHACWIMHEDMLIWIFGGIPLFFSFGCISVNNLIIYIYVRRNTQQQLSNNFPRAQPQSGKIGTDSSTIELDSQQRRIRAVATQAFLYVGCFFITYIWTLLLRVVEKHSQLEEAQQIQSLEQKLLPLLVLRDIFLPLQGFLNLFVYLRPTYLRCQRESPEASKLEVLQQALALLVDSNGKSTSVPNQWFRNSSRKNNSFKNIAHGFAGSFRSTFWGQTNTLLDEEIHK